MVYFAALLIFLLATAAIWFVAVALYHLIAGGPDLRHDPDFAAVTCGTVLLVALISFIPFPAGYLLSLPVWALPARGFLGLPWGRALLFFLLLATLSMVSRLVMLGILSY
jgi:hypothetical protein